MRRKFDWLLVPAFALCLSGCFDIEQGVRLNRDLSGITTFNFVVDMEPMVLITAAMGKAFSGDESPLTAEEIEVARAEFLAEREAEDGDDLSFDRADAEERLPEGVRLMSYEPIEGELRFGGKMKLAFDHYSKLQQIDFGKSDDEEVAMGPGKPSALEQPFAGLEFIDEGDTMLVVSPARNPLDELEEDNPMAGEDMGELGEMMKSSFESLRLATHLTLPFEIVEHNATRVEGDTLWWEYDLASFETMTPEELAEGIRVRFKK